MNTTSVTTWLAIGLAALQAADAAALGAQVAGFTLPPVVVFGLVIAMAPMAVVLANLPPVARFGSERGAVPPAIETAVQLRGGPSQVS